MVMWALLKSSPALCVALYKFSNILFYKYNFAQCSFFYTGKPFLLIFKEIFFFPGVFYTYTCKHTHAFEVRADINTFINKIVMERHS